MTGKSVLELTLVGRSKLEQFNNGTRSIENLSGSNDLYITYMHVDGYLVEDILTPQQTVLIDMVGGVIGYSSSDFRETLL